MLEKCGRTEQMLMERSVLHWMSTVSPIVDSARSTDISECEDL